MDIRITFLKGLKTLGFIVIGGIVAGLGTALTGAEFQAALNGLADSVAGAYPMVGALAAPVIKSGIVALGASIVAALENMRKHWND